MTTERRPLPVLAPPEEDTGTLEFLDFEPAPPCELRTWGKPCPKEAQVYAASTCSAHGTSTGAFCHHCAEAITVYVMKGNRLYCLECGQDVTETWRIIGPIKG